MKIAVLSGKGGAGKTFVSVNLAAVAGAAVYIDCDVEEPNGRVFFKPENVGTEKVFVHIPSFDASKCSGCRRCVDFCRFNALIFVKNQPAVFPEICRSCGGCVLACPNGAITEEPRETGKVEYGNRGGVRVATGVLNAGEASGVPVIKAALKKGDGETGLIVIDCPPGSSCSVMESASEADACLLVAEPTAFGLHNFKTVVELAAFLGKPAAAVINKTDGIYAPLEAFCAEKSIPVFLRIPYDPNVARLSARGEIVCEKDEKLAAAFRALLSKTGGLGR